VDSGARHGARRTEPVYRGPLRTGQCLSVAIGARDRRSRPRSSKSRRLGALLHDIGKDRCPGDMLRKRGADASEYDVIKTHPVSVRVILRTVPVLSRHVTIRGSITTPDGRVPQGLRGDDIPLIHAS